MSEISWSLAHHRVFWSNARALGSYGVEKCCGSSNGELVVDFDPKQPELALVGRTPGARGTPSSRFSTAESASSVPRKPARASAPDLEPALPQPGVIGMRDEVRISARAELMQVQTLAFGFRRNALRQEAV